ncbi:hypothetical protein A2331_04090 [Candidatus Falkowbacteria bacterium RIFOXYB2_FULL_34_18]|uniref:Uncharacterized protein n=1 Tax=Candidatus Falkowbacteria bacterium RIFOXYD2_FULL_34_120 TaxID=1798007 RepID=A0A1F5TRV2_9BACT|nr:MAG: hypothetical protein A2331_04090 [Candidatus Falkowbacteria bacterium RIFOXYB2_FULL_34_18]OGF29727.1 MAG: hypothetical protein A2500_00435 [Candidatus Falkowbacteria bacterium RIFOXYC12_FULL_34_55]OGF37408.1 MAG: hypothetical protein A2466_00285 [Candidatus Falkowbacteria bacterium RIFOXYC2_FULL_34_220]OGF39133.1 MAG: hypothetical protein A2515_00240 [Candidatus Falkowbacteria bacterium RIFOXYD12_FULL_34_57]OGF41682.1 MAG: hypothetical protein A2531_05960 [Candidatus Falkowbacteria bact
MAQFEVIFKNCRVCYNINILCYNINIYNKLKIMNQKKKYVILILAFVIIIDIILFVIWFQKKEKKSTGTNTKTCTESLRKINIKQMNDNQILDALLNKNNSLLKEKKNIIDKYFGCKINDINQNPYINQLEQYITNNNINDNFKNYLNSINTLDNKYGIISDNYGKKLDNDTRNKHILLYLMYAFTDLDLLCSGEVKDYCIESYQSLAKHPELQFMCTKPCEITTTLLNNEEYFNAVILNFHHFRPEYLPLYPIKDLTKNPNLVNNPKTYEYLESWKVAFAYRRGGEELVRKICDDFIEKDGKGTDYCNLYVNNLLNLLKDYQKNQNECNNLLNNLSNTICK